MQASDNEAFTAALLDENATITVLPDDTVFAPVALVGPASLDAKLRALKDVTFVPSILTAAVIVPLSVLYVAESIVKPNGAY